MSHLGSGCPWPHDQCKCDRPAADQIVRDENGTPIPEPHDDDSAEVTKSPHHNCDGLVDGDLTCPGCIWQATQPTTPKRRSRESRT